MFASQRFATVLGVLASVCLLASCQSEPENKTTDDANQMPKPSEFFDSTIPANAPTYLVGTMGSYAPFQFRDQNGLSIGFDMDIIYAIAARQKFHVTVLTHPWDGILNTLNTGERDIIISTVKMTPEREQKYAFTKPYFVMQDTFLAKTSNGNTNSFADLVKNQSKVSALAGSSQKAMTIKHGVAEANIITSDSQFLALKEMFADHSEAVIGDGAVMEYFALSYPVFLTKSFTLPDAEPVFIGIAVKKDNTQLRDQLNSGLKKIYEEGIYDKIYFKWFKKPVPKDFLPWTVG